MKQVLFRAFSNLMSLKVQIIIYACVMFSIHQMTEETWKELIIALVVVRGASDVTAIIKNKDKR